MKRRPLLLYAVAAPMSACLPVTTATLPPRVPYRGTAAPRLIVFEAGDFRCPFCAEVRPAVNALLSSHGDRIAVAWLDYPLARHEHALVAAQAAREVRAQRGDDAFWRYHDVLFANQHALARADLARYAEAFGVDQRRFDRALQLQIHKSDALADKRAVDAWNAPAFGTPAFRMEQDVFVGTYDHAALVELVEEKL